jgi:hypothetical protein
MNSTLYQLKCFLLLALCITLVSCIPSINNLAVSWVVWVFSQFGVCVAIYNGVKDSYQIE